MLLQTAIAAVLHLGRETVLLGGVVVTGQTKLLEVVDALSAPGGLTRRLDRR